MVFGVCRNCKKEKEIAIDGKSKDLCHSCYKKLLWKPRLVKCKRCERLLPMHSKGLCAGCYNSVFHLEKQKKRNARLAHNIPIELYEKLVKSCTICGFDKIVDLHHLDRDHSNVSESNLVGLCPNHHKMLHDRRYSKEIAKLLNEKGYKITQEYRDDDVFKN